MIHLVDHFTQIQGPGKGHMCRCELIDTDKNLAFSIAGWRKCELCIGIGNLQYNAFRLAEG